MVLTYLELNSFRNFGSLELALPSGLIVLCGDNAQGKSNLLESIVLLAATRSPRAEAERELINWRALEDPLPVARVVAEGEGQNPVRVEVALRAANWGAPKAGGESFLVEKRFKVNGLPQPASQIVGLVKAILFSTEDVDLVGGAPSLRRRFLDIALSQRDRHYLRHLHRYQRVLSQRNHLLRRIGQGMARTQELAFWDGEVVSHGSAITLERGRFLSALQEQAVPIHQMLSSGKGLLSLAYQPGVPHAASASLEEINANFRAALGAVLPQEIRLGSSQIGPHRDDLVFTLEGVDMGVYGSRGQRRTIALSLRLAEVGLQTAQGGEPPLVLLDDVFSELDPLRRGQIWQALSGCPQAIITTTDLGILPQGLLDQACLYRVREGVVTPWAGGEGP